MATWADLSSYVRKTYRVSDEGAGMIKLVFETDTLRSQAVILWHRTLADGEEEWVQIESPFGELGIINLGQALQAIGNTVCGGMALVGNLVTFRHAVPLLNLNINEFERPLTLVTTTADQLEKALNQGKDQY
jgi:hypothetical protein